MALYTEETARACLRVRDGKQVFFLSPEDRLTPAAREWLTTNHVEIIRQAEEAPKVYTTLFGGTLTEKPEHMTHLSGNVLVFKDHPRIVFRGMIDALEAELLLAGKTAGEEGFAKAAKELSQVLDFVRNLIRCDVLGEKLGEFQLCGLDEKQLREQSHHPQKYFGQPHFMPGQEDSRTLLAVNKVRVLVRQTELAAYRAFKTEDGAASRDDIILALNRLSSLMWIMVIKLKAGKYGGTK